VPYGGIDGTPREGRRSVEGRVWGFR